MLASSALFGDQSVTIQDTVHGTCRRQLYGGISAADELPDLRSSPFGLFFLEPDNELLYLKGELIGMLMRGAAVVV